MWYTTETKAAEIGLTTMFSLLTITDIAGNAIVCLLILKFKDMRIPMNYLILNLAVADIMVALFIVPRFIFVHLFKHPDGMTGTVLCKLLTGGNLIWIGSVATAFTLVVVAIERYHAVVNSHSNQGQLTAAKVEIIVPVIWLFAVIFNLPLLLTIFYNNESDFCMQDWPQQWMVKANTIVWYLVTGVIPIIIMAVLYSRVVVALWFQNEDTSDNVRMAMLKVRRRVTKMVVTVSAVFALCRIPALTMYVVSYFSPSQDYSDVLHIISVVLVTLNSSVNPFIYALVNQRFRQHIKELICCLGACRNNDVDPIIGGEDNNRKLSNAPPVQVVVLRQVSQEVSRA
ncbi:tachykinin-like peptides receptor 86C [Oculina patagonica]